MLKMLVFLLPFATSTFAMAGEASCSVSAGIRPGSDEMAIRAGRSALNSALEHRDLDVTGEFWLPDAHTEAPTIGSVLLAGIMLKMGTYGFIRIAIPLLPYGAQKYAPWIGLLAAIAIVYAALACLAQKDLKRLIAFSSVGHMGFVMLGIATMTEIGIQAAIFGMVAHGVITGMLFFIVGSVYDRYHTREIAVIGGGMSQIMPKMAGIFAFVAIAWLAT